jgi:hypothetical protein
MSAGCSVCDNGDFGVSGQVRDKDGGISSYSARVPGTNVAPTLNTVVSVSGFRTYNVRYVVSDPAGVRDMECYCVTSPSDLCGTGFYTTIDWGDNSGAVLQSPSQATDRTVTHTYAQPGKYQVRVTVRDKDGAIATNGGGTLTVKVRFERVPCSWVLGLAQAGSIAAPRGGGLSPTVEA